MSIKTLLAAMFAVVMTAGVASAQTAATTAPVVTKPAAPAAVTKPAPAAVAKPAATPAGAKVNLNTATASELDALPQVGKARSKVIMDERAKSSFKDWADFDTRTQHTSVNAGVKAKIKDLVSF